MAFKMKGSPHKMGTIQGTSSALKQGVQHGIPAHVKKAFPNLTVEDYDKKKTHYNNEAITKLESGTSLKMNSAFKQYDEGSTSTSTATVTNTDGTKTEYPPVRELSGAILDGLPGSVFKGGKNTGNNADIDADKYSRYLASLSKTDGDE